ncbi:unnamed protein product [Vitrella brassicaformis CCMP3155]|uniref:Uncharacterized protein n=1 Tax=Vitrella brassicaformis (strain CCMP3155) TaxID=1169540 RepID=A0A0G4GEA0_VITBC|nr:unnamed protein product [Vitrella brassicaformis CCMP3155]|eukprot:CEM27720.1 unnamed protein product [Vitrella brassicaformis CCMP3155]
MRLSRFHRVPRPATLTGWSSLASMYHTLLGGPLEKFYGETLGHFGSVYRQSDPHWAKAALNSSRVGKDSMDWFFRAFNKLQLYELFLKDTPRFWLFVAVGSCLGTWYWNEAWNALWCYCNKGKLYRDNPYNYPEPEWDGWTPSTAPYQNFRMLTPDL